MSSGGSVLSDSGVLEAFTDAYNDQFRRMMNLGQAPSPSPSPAPSSCGLCRQLGGGGGGMLMSQQPEVLLASSSPPAMMEKIVVVKAGPSSQRVRGGKRVFWTIIVIMAVVGLLLLLTGLLCRSKANATQNKLYASHAMMMPSVEAAMAASNGGLPGKVGAGRVNSITDPSDVKNSSSAKSLIMYYATWCGHCTQLKPMFEKVAQQNAGKADFLCCEHSILEKSGKAGELGIQGYPTIIAFSKGTKQGELVGNVGAEKLAAFVREAIQQ